MRKIITVIMVLFLIGLSLSGCRNNDITPELDDDPLEINEIVVRPEEVPPDDYEEPTQDDYGDDDEDDYDSEEYDDEDEYDDDTLESESDDDEDDEDEDSEDDADDDEDDEDENGNNGTTANNPGPNHQLIGTWGWDYNTNYVYTFRADGTGSRGQNPQVETFQWAVAGDGHIYLTPTNGEQERLRFTRNGHLITLGWQGEAVNYYFIQRNVNIESHTRAPLVARWTYEGDTDWAYNFETNGRGSRGIQGSLQNFEWWISANNLLFLEMGSRIEIWNYGINNNVLTLTYLQNNWYTSRFNRVTTQN